MSHITKFVWKSKIWHRNSNFITVANENRETGLPVSDAYANEIRYFVECINENKATEKVKPSELEVVIDILNII